MISYALLLVTDFCIMAWVFTSIIGTRRTLRIRKNMVKLAVYNHFAYALIFSIIAAIGFVIWDLLAHLYPSEGCLKVYPHTYSHYYVFTKTYMYVFIVIDIIIVCLHEDCSSHVFLKSTNVFSSFHKRIHYQPWSKPWPDSSRNLGYLIICMSHYCTCIYVGLNIHVHACSWDKNDKITKYCFDTPYLPMWYYKLFTNVIL